MLIYNVTINTLPEVSEEWLLWMRETHIPEMLQTGLFTKYQISQLRDQNIEEGITFVVQYYCESVAKYETYLLHHDAAMRQKSHQQFGNKIVGFRTAMDIIE